MELFQGVHHPAACSHPLLTGHARSVCDDVFGAAQVGLGMATLGFAPSLGHR
ncbi:MAG: hypothetical protein ACK6BG_02050 [Cyanobacteriota bacterium]